MTPGFVASVLEGFEGTLEEVLDRLGEDSLKREVTTLREHIAYKRQEFEAQDASDLASAIS